MKRNLTKRTLAGVLSILCAAGMVTTNASFGGLVADTAITASAKTFGDYECELLEDGTVEITNYTGSDEVVEIPSKIGGRKVTSIGDSAFWGSTSLTSVTIPDSVTSIGNSAFYGCTSLTSITIPDSVTSIEAFAFEACESLTSITIPDSVTSIIGGTFTCCTSLTSITIPDSVISIGSHAFYGCTSLTSVTIPDSVTSIGDSAFGYCTSLTSVTIPDSVTSIGFWAFEYCTSLTSITIPDSVTEFGAYAFYNTEWLNNKREEDPLVIVNGILIDGATASGDVIIPNSVTTIGAGAFGFCNSLTSITIPNSVTEIGYSAFECCWSLKSVSIPDSVTRIERDTFSNCKSLTTISIPDSVTSIGEEAFGYCTSLTSITIPDSVTLIRGRAFEYCTSLTSIIIPDSVTSIGDSAFVNCNSLISITIPDSVTLIGEFAFGLVNDNMAGRYFKLDGFKIYCYSGTAGEQYAIDNGFDYELLDNVNPTVTFEKGNGAVKLKWNKVKNAEKYGIAGYIGGKWKLLDVGPAKASSYVLKNLTAGRNYKVAVVAMFDGKWNMDFSKAITVTPNAPVYPDVKSEVKGGYCRLTWEPVENAEGYAVAFYDNGWKVLKTLSADTLTYTSTKLATGTYHAAVCVKLNGKWVTNSIKSHALTITIE